MLAIRSVSNWSLGLGLRILALTLFEVLRRVDVVTSQNRDGFPTHSRTDLKESPTVPPFPPVAIASAGRLACGR